MISGFLQGFQILQCVSAPDKRQLALRARPQRHICGRKPHFAYNMCVKLMSCYEIENT